MRRDLKKIRDTKDRSIVQSEKDEVKNKTEKVPKKKPGIVNQDEQNNVSDEMEDTKGEIYIEDTRNVDSNKEPEKKESEKELSTDEILGKKKNMILNSEEEIVNKKE